MAQIKPWDHTPEFGARDGAYQAPVLTPVEARQGIISGRVRLVLVVSLMLAVIAGAITYAALV